MVGSGVGAATRTGVGADGARPTGALRRLGATTTSCGDGAGLSAAGRDAGRAGWALGDSGTGLAWITTSPLGAGMANACGSDSGSPNVNVGMMIAPAAPAVASAAVSARVVLGLMIYPPRAEKTSRGVIGKSSGN